MRYPCVIFDLDGTLVDTSEGIGKAFDRAASRMDLAIPSSEEKKELIGPPVKESFRRLYGLSEADARRGAELFREEYAKPERIAETSLYPGVIDLLRHLFECGTVLAVATNKRTDCALAILHRFGINGLFTVVCGSEPGTFEGKGEILSRCLAGLGVRGRGALLIGDTMTDLVAAEDNGLDFLAVSYGFGFLPGGAVPGSVGLASTASDVERLLAE